MDSETIYKILSKKEHNSLYLKRYVKFLDFCKEYNLNNPPEYIEKHHICPKGKNFFPEYSSFKKNPWNKIELSARQHFIAHLILAKAYGGYAISALFMMTKCISKFNLGRESINSRLFEYVKINYKIPAPTKETIEKMKISRMGRGTYKDKEGNFYRLNIDDPLIKELNLKGTTHGMNFPGCNKGYVTCKNIETGEKLRVTKDEFDKNEKLVGVNKSISYTGYRDMKSPDGKYSKIHDSEAEQKIKEGYIYESPTKGKPATKIKNTIWINNGIENLRIKANELEYYKNKGYIKGRIKWAKK